MQDHRDQTAVGFREVVGIVWRARLLVVLITAVVTIAAGIGGMLSKKTYRASVLMSLAQSDSGNMAGIGAMFSQLGPLAAAVGVSSGGIQKAEAVALLESRSLTQRFIEENGLLPVLFAAIWDPEKNAWKLEDSQRAPSMWMANESFKKIRGVVQDAKTGLITLNITWTDPEQAASWANGLVRLANQELREQAIRESERNIAYLNNQVANTELVQVRMALNALIENEIKQGMLARGKEQYALKVLDPAVPPEAPSSPRLLVWLLGGVIAGTVMSLLFVFLRVAWIEGG